MEKVLITGGSGLVGRGLTTLLLEKGYQVSWLSRKKIENGDILHYQWDVERGFLEEGALEGVNTIIHLAGESIGSGRWTASRKQRIVNSRVESARLLFERVSKMKNKPGAFISSSAIGYYGAVNSTHIFQEDDLPRADDFLSRTCRAWEDSARRFSDLGMRQVCLRAGVVLSAREGALQKLRLPVTLGLGSALGRGTQYMPWIHLRDLSQLYLHAIENKALSGPLNAVAPEHVTNREFTRTMARILGKPFWFPAIPAGLLKLLLGSMSGMLLYGSRVSANRIISSGFEFSYPGIETALANCLAKNNS